MPYCTPWQRCYQCQWRVLRMRALVWPIFCSCLQGKICDKYLGCSCSEADQKTVSIFHITPSATGSLTEAPQCCGNRDNGLSSSLSARIDVSGKILWLTLIWHFAECAGKVERWRAGTNDGGDKSRIFHIWFHRLLMAFFFPIGLSVILLHLFIP